MPFVQQKSNKKRKIPFPWIKFSSMLIGTTLFSWLIVFLYKIGWMINHVGFCKEWFDYSIFSVTQLDCWPCPPGVICNGDQILGCASSSDHLVEHPLYIANWLRKIFVPVCVKQEPEPVPLSTHLYAVVPYILGALSIFGAFQYLKRQRDYKKMILDLSEQSIQMVKRHSVLRDTNPKMVLPQGLDCTHLRDHFLFPKYSLKQRNKIWKDVSKIVTSNANITEQKVMFKNDWHLVWSLKSTISDNEQSDIEE